MDQNHLCYRYTTGQEGCDFGVTAGCAFAHDIGRAMGCDLSRYVIPGGPRWFKPRSSEVRLPSRVFPAENAKPLDERPIKEERPIVRPSPHMSRNVRSALLPALV